MTVTIDLPEDSLARLRAEATRRGVSIDLVIAELTTALPEDHVPTKRTLSFIGLGRASRGRLRARLSLLVVDTSVLLAAADKADPDHGPSVRAIERASPLVTTAFVITETHI